MQRAACGYSFGFITRPMKSMLPVGLWRITNRNGWSARKTGGGGGGGPGGAAPGAMITAVAAAASVPFSLTSTNAL